jgi:hypothetical protein
MLTFAVPESLGSLLEMDNGGPSTEVAAKSLDSRLQWAQRRGYKAFRLQPRYNLASFRALRLPLGTLLLVDYSDLRTDHCPDFWPRPP